MYMYIAQHLPCLFWQLPALIIASTTKSSQIGPTIYLLLCMLDSNVLDSAQINWSWCFAIGEMVCLFCCVGVMVFFILICHCPLHHWALAHLTIGIQSNHPPTRMYWMHSARVRAAYLSWKIANIFVCILMPYVCGNALIWAMNFPFTDMFVGVVLSCMLTSECTQL